MFPFSYPLEVYPNQRDDNNVDEGDGDGIKPPMHRMSCGERNQNRTRRWSRQKATTSYDVEAEEL